MDYTQIESLFNKNVEELYADLGRESRTPGLGMEPTSEDKFAEEGRRWLARNRDDLAKCLCETGVVSLFISSERVRDRIIVAAAIADLISTLATGVAAFTVSVLLIKEGLDTLCSSNRT
jgi:hypothetical protein